MIRKIINRVLRAPTPLAPPTVIPFEKHGITREKISQAALKVIDKLQEAGFVTYIVGGAVRDLLLGIDPKDFDVATSATPEQVHALFRRSRIIGRRFRLVHVMSSSEIIEVSTFRGSVDESEHADETGRILQDNVFGSEQQDAERRDFTINALFYNPANLVILDYQNGVADIQAKRLVTIGDPAQRYREDPVRMLRAVRLAAKLGLKIGPEARQPIKSMAPLLQNVPAARLFEEMLKLLLSGRSLDCLMQLREEGLHHGFFPLLDIILEQPLGERFVTLALQNTDQRIRLEKPVSPGFLFAALLWHQVLLAWKELQSSLKPVPALFQAMNKVLEIQEEKLAIPRRYGMVMKEIWALQPRFENRSGRRPLRLLEHPRFRAGYDFLLLRGESGEIDIELGKWWETFQFAEASERQAMLSINPPSKKRRRKSNSTGDNTAAEKIEKAE